jgi:hypothetical protein
VVEHDTANAIPTGADGGNTSELMIVRNLFYDMDHALLVKNAGSAVFDNNTVVTIRSNQFSVVLPACINFGEPHGGDPDGRGVFDGRQHLLGCTRAVAFPQSEGDDSHGDEPLDHARHEQLGDQ